MSAKSLGQPVQLLQNVELIRPDFSKAPPDFFDDALNRLGEKHHDEIWSAAWEKWYSAYYDMIFETAYDVVWENVSMEDKPVFDKALEVQLDKEIESEMERTFQRFYDYEFRKKVTREMVEKEIKELEAGR